MIGWTFQQKQTQERNQSPTRVTSREGSCHGSYTFWRNGLNGLSFYSQPSDSGFVKSERKCGLLMYASISTVYFLSCFLSNLSLFSLVFPVYSSVFYSFFSTSCLFLYYSWPPLIYRLPLWDLPLLSLNRFWLLIGIPPGLPTNLSAIQPLPLPKVCWLHHSPFPDKITCLVSYLSLFLFYPFG